MWLLMLLPESAMLKAWGKHLRVMAGTWEIYLTPFWDPATGLPGFTNQIMFILAGIHPANEMKIVDQDDNSIRIRLKNVDMPFKQGPMLGVTYDEYLEFSYGVLVVLADFMKLDFSHAMVDDGWYEISIKGR